jgi:hypothetical protein
LQRGGGQSKPQSSTKEFAFWAWSLLICNEKKTIILDNKMAYFGEVRGECQVQGDAGHPGKQCGIQVKEYSEKGGLRRRRRTGGH